MEQRNNYSLYRVKLFHNFPSQPLLTRGAAWKAVFCLPFPPHYLKAYKALDRSFTSPWRPAVPQRGWHCDALSCFVPVCNRSSNKTFADRGYDTASDTVAFPPTMMVMHSDYYSTWNVIEAKWAAKLPFFPFLSLFACFFPLRRGERGRGWKKCCPFLCAVAFVTAPACQVWKTRESF